MRLWCKVHNPKLRKKQGIDLANEAIIYGAIANINYLAEFAPLSRILRDKKRGQIRTDNLLTLRVRKLCAHLGKNYKTKPRESDLLVKLLRVYARMTWLGEAMKDGVSTDMPRGAANWL